MAGSSTACSSLLLSASSSEELQAVHCTQMACLSTRVAVCWWVWLGEGVMGGGVSVTG